MTEILDDEGFVIFFVDDGNLSGNFDKMLEVIQYILEEGSKFGYKMSVYVNAKNHLVEVIGLSEFIVKVHPDDAEDYGVAALYMLY